MKKLTEAREGRKTVLEVCALQTGNKDKVMESEGGRLEAEGTGIQHPPEYPLCRIHPHADSLVSILGAFQ